MVEKDNFEILWWPYVTFKHIWGHTFLMKNVCFYNVRIYRKFYQNLFINKYARKKKAKISKSRSPRVSESQSNGVL